MFEVFAPLLLSIGPTVMGFGMGLLFGNFKKYKVMGFVALGVGLVLMALVVFWYVAVLQVPELFWNKFWGYLLIGPFLALCVVIPLRLNHSKR